MDHDHAFSEDEDIPSQTSEYDETLQQAAKKAVKYAQVDLGKVLEMACPPDITEQMWQTVLQRCRELKHEIYCGNNNF